MTISVLKYRPGSPRSLHHVAICPVDLERSIRFYREGIGLSVLSDEVFSGPYQQLLGLPCDRLRSIFLGDPASPHTGIIELIDFTSTTGTPPRSYGFFWLSFWVDVHRTVKRLDELALCRNLQQVDMDYDATVATVDDPDGVKIELISNSLVPAAISTHP